VDRLRPDRPSGPTSACRRCHRPAPPLDEPAALYWELAGLTWRALDLDGARLTVEQQLTPAPGGGVAIGPPKSERSRRTIALDPETVDALREHRDAQVLERALAGPAYIDRDLVFADELGGPIHPRALTERFARYRKAAGIPTGTLHVLRHSAAELAGS
jgi:integrase